jgi:SHS2 domain-containing protein
VFGYHGQSERVSKAYLAALDSEHVRWSVDHGRGAADYRSSPMVPFRVLEHTADVGFEAFGRTREEVFANAGRALYSLIVDLDSISPRLEVAIEASASGSGAAPADLLVDWLNEILYLYDAEGWLLQDFEIRSLNDRSIAAVGHGEKFDPARHQIKLLVKAITYHQLALGQAASRWRAQVYVDI